MIESIGTPLLNNDVAVNRASLAQEDFIRLFLAQLQFQDPLEPVDNKEFLAQLAQFSSVDQSRQLNEKIDALLTFQSASQSVGLIGKTVDVNVGGELNTGTVTAIRFVGGVPSMTVQFENNQFLTDVSLAQVSLVRE